MNTVAEQEKALAARVALAHIKNNMTIGLGTGSSAYYAIKGVGEMVQQGLTVKAVPTSEKTKELAQSLGIPLIDINSVDVIDVTIDGADEFTENLELIKGGGGALLREKIVASKTKLEIIITDASKKVNQLGAFKVPIEVIPFASGYVKTQLQTIGGQGVIRATDGNTFITDQGNLIIDTDFGLIANPAHLAQQLDHIVGVVAHGLFIDLADMVIMGADGKVVSFVNG